MIIDRDNLHAVAVATKGETEYSIHFPVFRRELVRIIIPTLSRFYNYLNREYGEFSFQTETAIDFYEIALSLCKTEEERKKLESFVEKILFGAKAIDASGKIREYSEIKFSEYMDELVRGELLFFCCVCRYWTDEFLAEAEKTGLLTLLGVTEYAASLSTKSQQADNLSEAAAE